MPVEAHRTQCTLLCYDTKITTKILSRLQYFEFMYYDTN